MHVSFGKVRRPKKWWLVLAFSDFCCWKIAETSGAKGLAALKSLQRKPDHATSFFRRVSADCQDWDVKCPRHANSKHEICAISAGCKSTATLMLYKLQNVPSVQETALHYALQQEDLEMIQILQKEASRQARNHVQDFVNGTIKDGIMTFQLETKTTLWFWPQDSSKLGYRTGPSDQDAFAKNREGTTIFIFPGDSIQVRELRGSWIRCDGGWLPLIVGSNKNFVRRDPALIQLRNSLQAPELQPVSTGFARGRAFRAKKLRNFGLSRGIEDDDMMYTLRIYGSMAHLLWFTLMVFFSWYFLDEWCNVYGSRSPIVEIFPTCPAKEGEVEPRWCRRKPSLCERHGDRGELCATQDEVSWIWIPVGCRMFEGLLFIEKMSDDDWYIYWYDEWELKEALQPCGLMTTIPTLGHKDHWGFLFQVFENILRLETAIQWAIRGGMAFKTLAACSEIFQQNQPSDFLGTAVQCALELLVWVSKLEHNANPP